MGYSISWIAVLDASPDQGREALGLRPTGKTGETLEYPVSGTALPSSYVVVLSDMEDPLQTDASLKALSAGRSLIRCQVEEHVMYCSAEGWIDGERAWSVRHASDKGIYDLDAEGALPDGFEEIRAELVQEQDEEGGEDADVDMIFDIPMVLAQRITGFKHDEYDASAGPPVFEELVRSS